LAAQGADDTIPVAASEKYVTYSPGPDLERELQRWLAVNPRSNAAAGFRAGWARMARLVCVTPLERRLWEIRGKAIAAPRDVILARKT
jgi:hypothetical protein